MEEMERYMLKDFSIQMLRDEIKRRESQPTPLYSAEWSKVRELCIRYIDELGGSKSVTKQHIFEQVMECAYGKDIWDYINKPRL